MIRAHLRRFFQPRRAVLDAVFAETGAGLALLDRHARVVRANPVFGTMFGVALGADAFLGVPAPAGPRLRAAFDTATASTQLTDLANGASRRAVALTITPVAGGDGAILLVTDRTAEQVLAEQLGQALRLKAVGQLAAGVAHDVNNLLSAIQSAAEESLDRIEDRLDRANLEQIISQVRRGAVLTRQLLAYGCEQTLMPKIVPVNAAVTAVAPLLRRLIGEGVHLDIMLDDANRAVRIDPAQLEQVLVNLSVNGGHAMAGQGSLVITTGRRLLLHKTRVGPATAPPGRYITIAVRDAGCGMAGDVLARIFDPFFTTRRDAGGTGLGLSTVIGIVQQSGGFLQVESRVGQGSCFTILLPRDDTEQVAARAQAPPLWTPPPSPLVPSQQVAAPTPISAAGQVVVLVEDEAALRALAQRALTRAGFAVQAFETAEAALALDKTELSCVVSDVTLPGMDGATLVERLRAEHPNLPAVLMSGYADQARRAQVERANIAFLAKPFALRDLTDAVAAVIRAASVDAPVS